MTASYKDTLADLRAGRFAPVYFLCGEEPYYIDALSSYIESHVLDEAAKSFDQTIFYGKDLPSADIAPAVSAAKGYPMFGGHRVVIVKEAQHLKRFDALALYLDCIQPSAILVVCYKYGKPDKRTAWAKKLASSPHVRYIESEPLRDYEVEKWISAYLSDRVQSLRAEGRTISVAPQVPALLAANLGTNLSAIVSAVQKLIDGLPPESPTIDAALVERNVGISKDFNVFELQRALIDGDVAKANRIALYFASSKDHPMIKELGIIYSFFANLMLYHYLPDTSDTVAAQALGINRFFVKDYAKAARRYSAGKTFRIIGHIRAIDARLKGINNPSATQSDLWKELIYKIMH